MKELEEIRDRAAVVTSSDVFDLTSAFIQVSRSQEDMPVLLAAIENVLERCEHMDRSKPVGDWYYNEITGAIQRALGVKS